MAEERIYIEVDDSALDAAMAKADLALGRTDKTIKETRGKATDVDTLWGKIQTEAKGLEGISRSQRLILTQMPGMRELLGLYYKFKMIGGGELSLGIIILAIYAIKMLQDLLEEADKRVKEQEDILMKYQHLTRFEAKARLAEEYRSETSP